MKFPMIEINEDLLIKLAQNVKVEELYLFDSVLHNDFNDKSDIDILISFKKDVHYSYFEFCELRDKFRDILNRSIDLVEKESLKNPYRRKEILKSARKIYAS
ncbi:MAG: nucleotidyltransferase domain-containing protein [Candidatus Cloacimonetes bacterium]|nr:nucleotidyltransferase domain-containing protein [Candidatus Cloacimonadota bacterium]